MIQVKRANRVLRIEDTELNYYLKLGYVQIDKDGRPMNVTKNGYTVAEYEALLEKNKSLEARIAELTKAAEEAKAQKPTKKAAETNEKASGE